MLHCSCIVLTVIRAPAYFNFHLEGGNGLAFCISISINHEAWSHREEEPGRCSINIASASSQIYTQGIMYYKSFDMTSHYENEPRYCLINTN